VDRQDRRSARVSSYAAGVDAHNMSTYVSSDIARCAQWCAQRCPHLPQRRSWNLLSGRGRAS